MSRKYNIIYGGTSIIEKKVFYIYTTGIINCGNIGENNDNIIKRWNDGVRQNIISKIPPEYNIEICHYDPIIISEGMTPPNDAQILEYVRTNLIVPDEQAERVNKSEFNKIAFNSSCVKLPYLVFDMAHYFKYVKSPGVVKIGGYYREDVSTNNDIPLHVLRTGFIGDEIAFHLAKINSFNILPDGTVRTFVDQIISNPEYIFYEDEPTDFITIDIKEKVAKELENVLTEISSLNPGFLEISNLKDKLINDNNLIIAELALDHIWSNTPLDNLIDNIVEYIVSNNYELSHQFAGV